MVRVPLLATLLALSSLLAACPGSGDGTPDGGGATRVDVLGTIDGSATWTAGHVYVLSGAPVVVEGTAPCTLTIEPGTVVKFAPGAGLLVGGGCRLVANGATFTSLADDAHGGDTDDAAAPPAKGSWDFIWIAGAEGSSIADSEILYAGGFGGEALRVWRAMSVTGTTIAHTGPSGAFPYLTCALDATNAPAGTVLTGNTFFGDDVPLCVNLLVDVNDSNVFTDPAHASNPNLRNLISVQPLGSVGEIGVRIDGDRSWSETEVPFVASNLVVGPTGRLLLGAGVTVKFYTGGEILVTGALVATGTSVAPVSFTSILDDEHGGDSNGDGTDTAPAKGDWAKITLAGPGSSLDHCEVLYAGGAYGQALVIDGTSASVTNSTVAHTPSPYWSALRGPYQYGGMMPALDAWAATAGTVIAGNVFFDDPIPLGVNGAFDLATTNVFADPAGVGAANVRNAIHFPATTAFTAPSRTLARCDVPYVVHTAAIEAGSTVTLADGVVVAVAAGGKIDVLTGGQLVVDAGGSARVEGWEVGSAYWSGIYSYALSGYFNTRTPGLDPFITGLDIVGAEYPLP